MKLIVLLASAMCVALVGSHPVPEGERFRSEALDRLVMVEADNETALRSKRTIGILRELFPEVSQMVEDKVNAIVAEIIRALGPVVLRNFLGNNRPGATGSSSKGGSTATAASPFDDYDFDVDGTKPISSNGRVSISLPTYPPDEDEDTESPNSTTTTTESSVGETTKINDAIQNAEGTTDVSNTIA